LGKHVHRGEEQQGNKDWAGKTPGGQSGHEGGITPADRRVVSNETTGQARRRCLEDFLLSVTDEVNRPQTERTIAKRAWLPQCSRSKVEMERASSLALQCFGVLNVSGDTLARPPWG